MWNRFKQFYYHYRNRNNLKGLTVAVIFDYKASDGIKLKEDYDDIDRSLNFNHYVIEAVLNSSGLAVEVDQKTYSENVEDNQKMIKSINESSPQAELILYGRLDAVTSTNQNLPMFRVTFRCVTRSNTIVAGGSYAFAWKLISLPLAAEQIVSSINRKRLESVFDDQMRYKERLYENNYQVSVLSE